MSRVQSIERAFAVLGALTDGPVGVTEVADRVDLPKSTVARLLGSLVREGVVEQVPGGTSYRLGARIVTLAASVVPLRSLVALARPHLVELASGLWEVAGLSGPDGFTVHYHGPSYRFPGPNDEREIAKMVVDAAANVSGRFRQGTG